MKRLTLLFFLITALTFGQEQEKKEAPWNVMYPEFMACLLYTSDAADED